MTLIKRAITLFVVGCLAACSGGDQTSTESLRAVPEEPQAQPLADPLTQWPPPPRPDPTPLETTEALTWEGVLVGELVRGVDVYKGVRYAAPPVGERRFRTPDQPPEGDDIDALEFGPACAVADPSTGSEDCLTLNVWAPRPEIRNTASPRPVIVHLLSEAPGTDHRLDGGDLAWNADAVVVTVNYRRGLLGFLAVPSMLEEAPAGQAGNFGLADVMAALTWIRDTVRTFSGDPDRVLLIGQGESAEVLCHILAAPAAQGLFHAAAIQSGACGRRTRLISEVDEFTAGPPLLEMTAGFAEAVGCVGTAAETMACLRAKPLNELLLAGAVLTEGAPVHPFRPTIDGDVVETNPHLALSSGIANVPFIVGSTRHEADLLFPEQALSSDEDYRALLATSYSPAQAEALYELFPTSAYDSALAAYLDLRTHVDYACQAEELARSASSLGAAFLFEIVDGFDADPFTPRASHGIDLVYLFAAFPKLGLDPDDASIRISQAMQSAWQALAHAPHLEPAVQPGGYQSHWPTYRPDDVQIMRFGFKVGAEDGHRDGKCLQVREILPL